MYIQKVFFKFHASKLTGPFGHTRRPHLCIHTPHTYPKHVGVFCPVLFFCALLVTTTLKRDPDPEYLQLNTETLRDGGEGTFKTRESS